MERVYFKTFGCRTNKFDTLVMQNSLQNYLVTDKIETADVVVVNSCTVTVGADSDVRHFINHVRKYFGKARIVFTGCGVKTQGAKLLENKSVNAIFDMRYKTNIDEFLPKNGVLRSKAIKPEPAISQTEQAKSFVKIQQGCDFRCSYCIIPYVRGRAKSKDEEQIVSQTKKLCSQGISEIVLTGTNLGSYGKDTNTNLAKLLTKLQKIKPLRRIRIGSLESSQIDDELINALEHEKQDKFLHIALQHVDDKILHDMNRINRYAQDEKLLSKLALKGFAIGADFILGFPTQTQQAWQESMKKLRSLPLTHIHSFIYSPRSHTKAVSMKPLSTHQEAKANQKELIDLVRQKNLTFRKNFSGTLLVHIETSQKTNGGYICKGYSQHYNKVLIHTKKIPLNWIYAHATSLDLDKTEVFL